MDRVVLKPGRERSVLRRHPWVFSGAVARVEGSPEPGATVEVLGADGGEPVPEDRRRRGPGRRARRADPPALQPGSGPPRRPRVPGRGLPEGPAVQGLVRTREGARHGGPESRPARGPARGRSGGGPGGEPGGLPFPALRLGKQLAAGLAVAHGRRLLILGRRHLGYGVYPSHYYALTQTLVDVLARFAGDDWNEDLHQTWLDGIEAVTAVMMRAHHEPDDRTATLPRPDASRQRSAS